MKKNHSLALITAYYLSKYKHLPYNKLGFSSQTRAHEQISSHLKMNPNTLKNMRDELDSIHHNGRVGWYQREIRPSRQFIVDRFQTLSEIELRTIVIHLLKSGQNHLKPSLLMIVNKLNSLEHDRKSLKTGYINHGPLQEKAEDFFLNYHQKTGKPIPGKIIDLREIGLTHNFEIRSNGTTNYLNVRGVWEPSEQILFTGLEWHFAGNKADTYVLILVTQLNNDPEISWIINPVKNLKPTTSIRIRSYVRWAINKDQITC